MGLSSCAFVTKSKAVSTCEVLPRLHRTGWSVNHRENFIISGVCDNRQKKRAIKREGEYIDENLKNDSSKCKKKNKNKNKNNKSKQHEQEQEQEQEMYKR